MWNKEKLEEDLRQRKGKYIYFLELPSQWGERIGEDEREVINIRVTENYYIKIKWKTKQNNRMTMKCQIINSAIHQLLGTFSLRRFMALVLFHLKQKLQGAKQLVGGLQELTVASDGPLEVLSPHMHLLWV